MHVMMFDFDAEGCLIIIEYVEWRLVWIMTALNQCKGMDQFIVRCERDSGIHASEIAMLVPIFQWFVG